MSLGMCVAIIVKIPDISIYFNKEYEDLLYNRHFSTYYVWKYIIDSRTGWTVYYTNALCVIIAFVSFFGIIFVTSHINIELFYRKKEIGCLQLFNVTKIRIQYILFMQYMRNVIISLVLAELLYHIAAGVTYMINGMNFVLSLWVNACIACGILLYSAIVISIPVSKYMRKNIISLNKE